MNDGPRRPRISPGDRRQVFVMAVSGLSFIAVLALIALLLHLVG